MRMWTRFRLRTYAEGSCRIMPATGGSHTSPPRDGLPSRHYIRISNPLGTHANIWNMFMSPEVSSCKITNMPFPICLLLFRGPSILRRDELSTKFRDVPSPSTNSSRRDVSSRYPSSSLISLSLMDSENSIWKPGYYRPPNQSVGSQDSNKT